MEGEESDGARQQQIRDSTDVFVLVVFLPYVVLLLLYLVTLLNEITQHSSCTDATRRSDS